jgi:chromosomal replication initiator protein
LSFARFVSLPENRSALMAVERLAACLVARSARAPNPLFLHGPAGTGKSHLATALLEDVTRRCPNLTATLLEAGDLRMMNQSAAAVEDEVDLANARQTDLLVVEDLQLLPAQCAETLVQLIDIRLACQAPMVFTASVGPAQLDLPMRLTSRLAAGLIVGLKPLEAPSRLALLGDKAQRRQLAVSLEVLAWLAEHLAGGRQLEGALAQLETLTRVHGRTPDLALVTEHFRELSAACQLTVDRIAQRVGGHFRVSPRQLCSDRRSQHVLLPRQVGMYLARQLTGLSLEQIGSYFGGRDHSTVLHACRKVEQALHQDTSLSGTIRQLRADLV